MGETVTRYRMGFNQSIQVEARPDRITSEAGALLARDVLDSLGVLQYLGEHLVDKRDPERITHPLTELVATSVILKALGWRDQDDADALRDDGALRLAVSLRKSVAALQTRDSRQRERNKNPPHPDGLASQPTLSRTVRMLSTDTNRETLRNALILMASHRIVALRKGHRMRYLTLDVDSLPISVDGHQLGSEYNGHYHDRIFHPLVASIAETGDIVDASLRPGNVHTAEGALDFILPLVDKLERTMCQVASVRMDAGFPDETLLSGLESRLIPYVARVKNNAVLDKMAAPYVLPPGGCASADGTDTWFHELTYQAQSGSRPRRVVLVTQRKEGELLLHHFWLVTGWSPEQIPAEALLELYRQRGTAEGLMGELMNVLAPALSCCSRPKSHYRDNALQPQWLPDDSFVCNEVILLHNLLAYETLHALRQQMHKDTHEAWSIKRLRERVLRVGARILVHARKVVVVIEQRVAREWMLLLRRFHLLHGPEVAS